MTRGRIAQTKAATTAPVAAPTPKVADCHPPKPATASGHCASCDAFIARATGR